MWYVLLWNEDGCGSSELDIKLKNNFLIRHQVIKNTSSSRMKLSSDFLCNVYHDNLYHYIKLYVILYFSKVMQTYDNEN